jgi:ABC-type polysaccharide/polyol phosphate transport system ATPase subunit
MDKIQVPEILKYAELEKFSDTKIKNFSSGVYSRRLLPLLFR